MEVDNKQRIIHGADELFMRYGVKSVTMDDISRHLSVSKKTIYQYFKDKDELVTDVANVHMAEEDATLDEIKGKATNAIEELFFVYQYVSQNVAQMNPSVIFDLKKYHPRAWGLFQAHKEKCIYGTIVRNLENGKKEGYYRQGINAEILATMRMQVIENAFDPSIFPSSKFDLFEVQMQLLEHFVMGVVTIEGEKLYRQYQKGNKK